GAWLRLRYRLLIGGFLSGFLSGLVGGLGGGALSRLFSGFVAGQWLDRGLVFQWFLNFSQDLLVFAGLSRHAVGFIQLGAEERSSGREGTDASRKRGPLGDELSCLYRRVAGKALRG